MPQLILFAPCDKVIVDKADNTVSLVSVIQEVTADFPTSEPLARNAKASHRWYVVATWLAEEGEEGRFQQRVSLTNPNGTRVLEAVTEFELSKRFHRTIGKISDFPIGMSGAYRLAIELRPLSEKEWVEKGSYPLIVHHRPIATHEQKH